MHTFDRQTDRWTDRILIASPRLHSMQCGKNIEFRVPYAQRYLSNTIHDTNHNAKLLCHPTNPNCNSKGNPNPTNPTNPNTRYRCEYSQVKSMMLTDAGSNEPLYVLIIGHMAP